MRMRYPLLLMLTILLSGCGQRGPLYLPEKSATEPAGAPPAPAEAPEDEDDSAPAPDVEQIAPDFAGDPGAQQP